jgi:hypothetical protein
MNESPHGCRQQQALLAVRLPSNPIITPSIEGYDVEQLGANICGPSLIRIPDWLPRPLGRYYLYFAHHSGDHIRLAYSDSLQGPWRLHAPGTLFLRQTGFVGHIASPDVHVDHQRRQIRMYFHGCVQRKRRIYRLSRDLVRRCLRRSARTMLDFNATYRDFIHPEHPWPNDRQMTRVATSNDGTHFEVAPPIIATSYLRAFRYGDWTYGIAMPFIVYRSRNGLSEWEMGPCYLDERIRHCAVLREGARLHVFYTCRGDRPEQVMMTTIDLSRGWDDWCPTEPVVVLQPEMEWEGALQPLERSKSGAVTGPVRQLRDPAIFEEDGNVYLLYCVAGESGIAIAKLHFLQ